MFQETYVTTFIRRPDKEQLCSDVLSPLMRLTYKNAQPFAELGSSPVPLEHLTSGCPVAISLLV